MTTHFLISWQALEYVEGPHTCPGHTGIRRVIRFELQRTQFA